MTCHKLHWRCYRYHSELYFGRHSRTIHDSTQIVDVAGCGFSLLSEKRRGRKRSKRDPKERDPKKSNASWILPVPMHKQRPECCGACQSHLVAKEKTLTENALASLFQSEHTQKVSIMPSKVNVLP